MPIIGSIIKKTIKLRGKLPLESNGKKQPEKLQKKTLRKLLKAAQSTAFGEQYKFQEILASDALLRSFQKNVPIYDYNKMHSEWWYRTLNGETYVSWPGRIKYFALSSGTSGATSKYIPVTPAMIKAIQKTSIRQIWSLSKYDFPEEFYTKGILMLGGSTHLEYNGTYFEGDLSGITAGTLPFWFQHFYKPGKRISRERNWNQKLDEIVKKAPEWDIGAVCGVPSWIQILFERIIAHYQLKNIHDIWPNLSIYVHGGVAFAPYIKGFESLLGKPITYMETYLASEGFIAYQSRPNVSAMELVLDNGIFYEFIPFTPSNFDNDGNLLPDAEAIDISSVEEGVDYGLLISTCSGAWRYLIGDTVRFTSKKLNEIIITGRTQQFMSLCGEHLSLDNLNRAIQMLESKRNIHIREFAVGGVKHSEGMFEHHWYIGTEQNIGPVMAAQELDNNLKLLNDDYRTERLHAITTVTAQIYRPEVFYGWMKKNGKEGGQTKFPRVLKNEKLHDWEAYLQTFS